MKLGMRTAVLANGVALILAGTPVEVRAQSATYYNNYGYDSYASQMVRDHINLSRTADRYASQRRSKSKKTLKSHKNRRSKRTHSHRNARPARRMHRSR